MLWYDAFGLDLYWKRQVKYATTGECLLKYNAKGAEATTANAPLKLKQLYVPFVLLLIGHLIALFLFAREKMYEYLMAQEDKANNKVSPIANNSAQIKDEEAIYSTKYFW